MTKFSIEDYRKVHEKWVRVLETLLDLSDFIVTDCAFCDIAGECSRCDEKEVCQQLVDKAIKRLNSAIFAVQRVLEYLWDKIKALEAANQEGRKDDN